MSHVTTPFSEILHLIPRHVFQKLERRHACGRNSRQFGFREHFTVMAFVMLAVSRSLRDALASLKAQGNRFYEMELFAEAHGSWLKKVIGMVSVPALTR